MSDVVVAVDANGADLGPGEVAHGARIAVARDAQLRVLLFGPAAECEHARGERVQLVDAPVSIAKQADPARAVRSTPAASIVCAAKAVGAGKADALVCGGSTGAALAAGLFHVKRARGIYRPALAVPVPVPGAPVTLLDVGANADVRVEHLVQFAFMGAAFARGVLGVENPRVALLSNGSEPDRGSTRVVEAHRQLSAAQGLAFVGNVEGDGLTSGVADVVVSDGFTGNIALKLIEGVSQTILGAVREAALSSPRSRLGGALLRPALRSFRASVEPERQGGAYLLGLRRLGVVAHGRFGREGIAEAILRGARGSREDVVGRTAAALEQGGAMRARPAGEPSEQRGTVIDP
ncbi:MAG: phosphate acyltransferase PlsX [Solirubrobacteraceae bacterium]